MEIFEYPSRSDWQSLCRRNIPDEKVSVDAAVVGIINRVAEDGDKALRELSLKFDKVEIATCG